MTYGVSPLYRALTQRCFEPVKRNKDGLRWISHRFEIRDGISLRDVMDRDMRQHLVLNSDGPALTFRGLPIRLDGEAR